MNDLATLAAAIEAARADLETYNRLRGAEALLAQLEEQQVEAQAAADRKAAQAAKDAEKARFAGLSDIRVEVKPSRFADNVLSNGYVITWTAPKWDTYSQTSAPGTHTHHGFRGLDTRVFAFLIEKHPEQIPPQIMELAPGDPYAAFDRYFVSMKRGHVLRRAGE